jgi:hypothetical protein
MGLLALGLLLCPSGTGRQPSDLSRQDNWREAAARLMTALRPQARGPPGAPPAVADAAPPQQSLLEKSRDRLWGRFDVEMTEAQRNFGTTLAIVTSTLAQLTSSSNRS